MAMRAAPLRKAQALSAYGMGLLQYCDRPIDIGRSIFTTSDLPRHVLSTHCNAFAVDSTIDKRHTLAI